MRSRLTASCRLLFLLLALIAALPQAALALTASQVYEQVKDSVVVVKAYDQKGKLAGLGSGVMLPSGDVITNYHVVKSGVRYTVGRGKLATPATVKAGDHDKDLCLLTAPGLTAKPAHLGKAARLKVGEPVYAVGAPQGLELSLSEGIVSQLRGGPPPIIQTTVAISKGSSGGGLFNAEGELVGITTFYLKDGQSLNFALPVEWIGEIAATAKKFIPYAGKVIPLNPDDADAWYNLGIIESKSGRHRYAIEAFEEAVRLKPDFAEAWNSLGNSYLSMGAYGTAIGCYLNALRYKPDYAAAWWGLGSSYARSGNRSAALEAVQQLRRLDPQKAESLYNQITKP